MESILELKRLIKTGESMIAFVAPLSERDNIIQELYILAKSNLKLPIYLWNLGEPKYFTELKVSQNYNYETCITLTKPLEIPINEGATPGEMAIAALKYFQKYLYKGIFIIENILSCISLNEGLIIKQLLININSLLNEKQADKYLLLLVEDELDLLASISNLITTLELKLPTYFEAEYVILTYLTAFSNQKISKQTLEQLTTAALGLHIEDIRTGLRQSLEQPSMLVPSMLQYKINCFKSLNLNFVPKPDIHNFGGLENLRRYIQAVNCDFQPEARDANIPMPKGCLLVGPPGTGKTLAANVSAQELGFPLISVDTGTVVTGGATYLKQLINRVEVCAPVVLYFDEFDKLFGANSTTGEDISSRHILGTLLTWLQDKRSPVFVIATLNRLDALPPELTRAGRFDEIFYVGFPNAFERKQIISLHAARFDERYQNGADPLILPEWRILLNKTVNCTGAELAKIVEQAAKTLWRAGKPMIINLPDLIRERDLIVPLYIRDTDRILAIENRARGLCKPASDEDTSDYAPPISSFWG